MNKIFIDGSAGTTGLRIYERLKEREDIDKKFRDNNKVKLFHQYVIGKLGHDWDGGTAWYQYRGKVAPIE